MAVSRWMPRFIGPLVLVAILLTLDVGDVAVALRRVDLMALAGACLAVLPTVPFRSSRWRMLVEAGGAELGGMEALHAYAFSIVAGAATPGRLGELVKVGHLRNRGVPASTALLSVSLDRLFDVVFLIVVGAGAVVAVSGLRSPWLIAAASGGAALSCGAVIAIVLSERGSAVPLAILTRLVPARWSQRVARLLESTAAQAKKLPRRTLTMCGVLTALTWLATYFAVYLCAVGLRLDVPFLDVCGVTAVSSLVTFLPISILGLGTRDAALIALLAPYGVAASDAVALSALYLGITLWVVLACAYSLLTPAARAWKRGWT